jgi:toxin ParE1/3/4
MANICIFTIPSSRDLENILDYLAEQNSLNKAEDFLAKINKKCRTLANFPNMGKSRDELLPSLRSFPIDNYLIFYRPINNGIEILRIVSGYRDLNILFEEN